MLVALLAVLAFPTLVRLRLLDLPLERDEGEYAYAGQLMLHGVPPYELVYNMKFPGTYAAYAVIEGIFGQTATAIRLGLLLVTTLTAILLYFLGKRMFGARAGVIAAGAYALLAIAPAAFGLYAHATHFVALFVVAAMLLIEASKPPSLQASESSSERLGGSEARRLFAAGALLALAVLMKQPAFVFVIFALIYVAVRSTSRIRDLAMVCAGGIAVAVLTVSRSRLPACCRDFCSGRFNTRANTQRRFRSIAPSSCVSERTSARSSNSRRCSGFLPLPDSGSFRAGRGSSRSVSSPPAFSPPFPASTFAATTSS